MAHIPAVLAPNSSPELVEPASGDSHRLLWFELFLVLTIAFAGTIASAIYLLRHGPGPAQNSLQNSSRWISGALHEITALFLLGYVLFRRGLRSRLQAIGGRWSLRDLLTGMFLWLGATGASIAVWQVTRTLQHALLGTAARSPSASAFFAHPGLAAIPYFLLNPFFEELIVRAFLMTEIIELTGSTALAVALSVAVQFSYHLYYGWAGATSVSASFLCFALYYARARKILPVIVAHEFMDIIGLIRLW